MKLRLLAAALPMLFAVPAAAEDSVPSAKDYPAPPAGWKVPRTAWGDPDSAAAMELVLSYQLDGDRCLIAAARESVRLSSGPPTWRPPRM